MHSKHSFECGSPNFWQHIQSLQLSMLNGKKETDAFLCRKAFTQYAAQYFDIGDRGLHGEFCFGFGYLNTQLWLQKDHSFG